MRWLVLAWSAAAMTCRRPPAPVANTTSPASERMTNGTADTPECADIDACRTIGERPFWHDHSLWRNPVERERAIRALTRACELGDRRDCNIVGNLYRNGNGVARDLSRARAYHARACKHEPEAYPEACYNQALDEDTAPPPLTLRKR
jgi:TPR repeat protein